MKTIYFPAATNCSHWIFVQPAPEYNPRCNPIGVTTVIDCFYLMVDELNDTLRPTIELFWTPDAGNHAERQVDINSIPGKYDIISKENFKINLAPANSSPINPLQLGYSKRLLIRNTNTSDFGRYRCNLVHPSGSPSITVFGFEPTQAIHIYKPLSLGQSRHCPSGLDGHRLMAYWDLLDEEICVETNPPPTPHPKVTPPPTTPTPTDTTIIMTSSEPLKVCCSREQVIAISASLSAVFFVCLLIVCLLFTANTYLKIMEVKKSEAAKLS